MTKGFPFPSLQKQLHMKDMALSAAKEQLRKKDEVLSKVAAKFDGLAQQLREAKVSMRHAPAVSCSGYSRCSVRQACGGGREIISAAGDMHTKPTASWLRIPNSSYSYFRY